ncbi:MAG TPA: hypothetical protein VN643_11275 [Pyrinomonadaceae bacterium]|nr:hypothetical protein [Pyrinomonadaceae bacterium]
MNRITRLTLFAVLLLSLSVLCTRVLAQSTLANAPSSDVVAEKKVYVEFDYISNYAGHRDGGFQSYIPRAVVGVGHNVEIGANVSYTNGFGVPQPLEIQPNIKWRFYESESSGQAASVGCILYAPVTHRTGADHFGLCYSVFSKRFPGHYGPRFTGGGYALIGRQKGNGARAGVIAGYEQPLAQNVGFVLDWFSGENRFGYVTPGVSFSSKHRGTLFTGYTIGNHGRKNNAFFTYYGITF